MHDAMMLALYIYFTVLGASLCGLMTESRLGARATAGTLGAVTACTLAGLAALQTALGSAAIVFGYTLIAHIPIMATCVALSLRRDWSMVFRLFSVVMLCTFTQHAATLVYWLSGQSDIALLATDIAIGVFLVIASVRFLRPRLLALSHSVSHGWWLPCAIMALYYATIVYAIPVMASESQSILVAKAAVSGLMAGSYIVIVSFLDSAKRELDAEQKMGMLSLQVSSLEHRMEAIDAAKDALRRERHDMKHRLLALRTLIENGKEDEALQVIGSAAEQLEATYAATWCEPPIIDAILSSYVAAAEQRGIRMEVRAKLSSQVSCEAELAVALANALDNAIRACADIPEDERFVHCSIIERPSVMVKVENPCTAVPRFDENGIPVSSRNGHGWGCTSIAAFAAKHDAVWEFSCENGIFTFTLVM